MATYYVDTASATGGNGTTQALSGANCAFQTIAQVVGKAGGYSAGDHILFKRGCTWAERLNLASSGSAGNPVVYDVYGEGNLPATITGGATGNSLYSLNRNNITVNHLTFTSKYALMDGSTSITLNYCVIKNTNSFGFRANNSATATLNNCLIYNCFESGIYSATLSHIIVRNCMMLGCAGRVSYGVDIGTGTIDIDYSLVSGNNYYYTNPNITNKAGITVGAHVLQDLNPRIYSYPSNQAYFTISLDGSDTTYMRNVAQVLNPLGVHITCYIVGSAITTQNQIDDIIAIASAGNEIGLHSWSHTDLTLAALFTVTTTNASATIRVNAAGKQLILSTTTPGNAVTVDWNASDKTLGDLKTAVAGHGWTITDDSGLMSNAIKLSSLADTGGAVTLPHDCTVDTTAFWTDEILDTQAWLLATIGVNAKTMSYPSGQVNDTLKAWIRDNTTLIGGRGMIAALPSYTLNSLDIWNVQTTIPGLTTDEPTARQWARHMAIFSRTVGTIFGYYANFVTEVDLNEWTWFAEEMKLMGMTILTFSEAITAIRADHSTADGITYTKTYSDVSDFRLQAGSPAINAGAVISGQTTDYIGKPVANPPDIGSHEYRKAQSIFKIGKKILFV